MKVPGQEKGRGRGQALVEFALIVPVFALILFALLDFGRVIYTQNTVEQAAREASRAGTLEAVMDGYNSASA